MKDPREELYNYIYPRSRELRNILNTEITSKGKITFARFMEIVLYHKKWGYYSNENSFIYNDYLTSPKLHYAFGKLIAKKLLHMWENMGKPAHFTIVEMGGGDGLLARQILSTSIKYYPEFHRAINYLILELNNRAYQEKEDKLSFCIYENLDIPLKEVRGCFISNELLDSFPVNIVIKKEKKLEEVFVALQEEELVEIIDKPSTDELEEYFRKLNISLPEGNKGEVNLKALNWLKEVAGSLKEGYIMTIDYGYTAEELFNEKRKEGTLMCFYQHSFNSHPFTKPGYQDITTHVDFTTLINEGKQMELTVEEYTTQREFLLGLGIEEEINSLNKSEMNLLDYNSQTKALNRLIDPAGLGKIKVLIQKKS